MPTQKTAASAAVFSACQKSLRLFCALKKRHIFCEAYALQKISLRSSKSLIAQTFLMAIIKFEVGLAPSSSPAARLSFLSSIGLLTVWKDRCISSGLFLAFSCFFALFVRNLM
jgi:hypothetical protein